LKLTTDPSIGDHLAEMGRPVAVILCPLDDATRQEVLSDYRVVSGNGFLVVAYRDGIEAFFLPADELSHGIPSKGALQR
jgi:hypothetical protein